MSDLNNDTVVPSIEGDAPNGTQNAKDTIINSEVRAGFDIPSLCVAQSLTSETEAPRCTAPR